MQPRDPRGMLYYTLWLRLPCKRRAASAVMAPPETRPLTLGSVLAALAFRIDESLQSQVIDPARPDEGALLAHDTGLADASHTATVPLLVGCAFLSLAHTR